MNAFYYICCLIPFFLSAEIYYLYKVRTNIHYIHLKTLFNILLISVLYIYMNANKLYNHIFIPLINIFFHTFVTIYFNMKSKKNNTKSFIYETRLNV